MQRRGLSVVRQRPRGVHVGVVFHRETMNIALCEIARICQAGFILKSIFQRGFFHGWNSRRVTCFGGKAVAKGLLERSSEPKEEVRLPRGGVKPSEVRNPQLARSV